MMEQVYKGDCMKYNHWLPKLLKVNAIVLFQNVYYAMPKGKVSNRLLRHEEKHVVQQREEGIIMFKIKYIYEFAVNYVRYRNFWKAYRNISYEVEAREAERDI